MSNLTSSNSCSFIFLQGNVKTNCLENLSEHGNDLTKYRYEFLSGRKDKNPKNNQLTVRSLVGFLLSIGIDDAVPSHHRIRAMELLRSVGPREVEKKSSQIISSLVQIVVSSRSPAVRSQAVRVLASLYTFQNSSSALESGIRQLRLLVVKEKEPEVKAELLLALAKFRRLLTREELEEVASTAVNGVLDSAQPDYYRIACIKAVSQFSDMLHQETVENFVPLIFNLFKVPRASDFMRYVILSLGELQKHVSIKTKLKMIHVLIRYLDQKDLIATSREASLILRQIWSSIPSSERTQFLSSLMTLVNKMRDVHILANLVSLFAHDIDDFGEEASLVMSQMMIHYILDPEQDSKVKYEASRALPHLIHHLSPVTIEGIIPDLLSLISENISPQISMQIMNALKEIAIRATPEFRKGIMNKMVEQYPSIPSRSEKEIVLKSLIEIATRFPDESNDAVYEFMRSIYESKGEDEWLRVIAGSALMLGKRPFNLDEKSHLLDLLLQYLSADANVITRASAARLLSLLIPIWTDDEQQIIRANLSLRLSLEDSEIVKSEILSTLELIGTP